MNSCDKQQLKITAAKVRLGIIEGVYNAKSGHPGGSLSAADIFTYLYFKELHIDPQNPKDPDRDRFVLSKGHCAPGLYAALAQRGYFSVDELKKRKGQNKITNGKEHRFMSQRIGNLPANINIMNPVPNKDAKTIMKLIRTNGKISGYQLSDGTVLSKADGVALAKQGGIRGVAIASRNGSEYLRSIPDGKESNNLGDLPSTGLRGLS